jgi:glucose dehydrogenase
VMDTAGSAAAADDDGQWIMPARNFASTRYSGLNQITAANAGQLRLAWSFSTGDVGVLQGGLFVLVIVAMWIPSFILDPCQ